MALIRRVSHKTANEAAIIDIIAKREMKLREIEQDRLRAIEEEKRRRLLQIEEQNRREKRLMENIEKQHPPPIPDQTSHSGGPHAKYCAAQPP